MKKNGPISIGSMVITPSPAPANWYIVPQLLPLEKHSSPHPRNEVDSFDIIVVYALPDIPLYHPCCLLPWQLWTKMSSVQ